MRWPSPPTRTCTCPSPLVQGPRHACDGEIFYSPLPEVVVVSWCHSHGDLILGMDLGGLLLRCFAKALLGAGWLQGTLEGTHPLQTRARLCLRWES